MRVNTDFPEFRSVEDRQAPRSGHAIWPNGATATGKRRQRDFSRAEQLHRTMIDRPGTGCGAGGKWLSAEGHTHEFYAALNEGASV